MTTSPEKTKVQFSTRDIGLAIRDFLEQQYVHHFADTPEGDIEQIDGEEEVVAVDVSDPSNLIVSLYNGQQFTVRIFAS